LLDERRQALARRYEKKTGYSAWRTGLGLILLLVFYDTGLSARLAHV
jgi:hypothetical protein